MQNEALNGGGTLFVNKHPDLKVRVVHGNTLTAAVILNEIPKQATEVFLTGATSKLGRAIALYLCRKKVRVLVSRSYLVMLFVYILINRMKNKRIAQMLTLSTERFKNIQKEAPLDCRKFLVQVTKYQAAQNCKVKATYMYTYLWTSFKKIEWSSYAFADMDSRKMDHTKRAKLCSIWDSFSSVCGATDLAV